MIRDIFLVAFNATNIDYFILTTKFYFAKTTKNIRN